MRNREEHALVDRWFQDYRQSLLHLIRRTVDCDENEAEDIVMDVFARACRSLQNRPETIAYPKRWLEKITRNVCSEEIKKRARERHHRFRPAFSDEEEDQSAFDSLEDDDVTTRPERVVERKEDVTHLYQEVAALPEHEKKAIYYHYTKEMTLEETARRVGRAPSTVSKDVHQGLKKLRVRLIQ